MTAAIVIPYRASATRKDAFERVHRQAKRLGLPIFIGDSGDEPFSIARTWNHLASVAGNWDYLVRWGADFLLEDEGQVLQALREVNHYTSAFAYGHRQTPREAQANKRYFQGQDIYGGPSVVTRTCWNLVGGFDERFVGYGAEDLAFVRGVNVIFGERERIASGGECVLWHPSAKRVTDAPDPYYERREANLVLYSKRIKPIRDAEEWADYVDTRYMNGRENPFHPLSPEERAKWF
jgi:hypothetical protein